MKKLFYCVAFCFGITFSPLAQSYKGLERPKLVVGIVIDQMRYDFLYRYWNRYQSDGGFKRLITQGYSCENTHYNYVPTYTAPGHAAIFTGAPPLYSGIVANEWYQKSTKQKVYCTQDTTVQGIGHTVGTAGKQSPRNMLCTTIADQIKLSNEHKSKTIGISLKDRGAILSIGHTADAAYWFDSSTGNWITSSYYMKELPTWVKEFNNQKLPDKMIKEPWNTLYPIETYIMSAKDAGEYEIGVKCENKNTFPHNFAISNDCKDYKPILHAPAGNELTKLFAIAAIENEKLGKGEFTDMLTISFSSTDYVGHYFGPNSVEAEDTYLRLDKQLAELLDVLDRQVGKNQYLVFLTADHGAVYNPDYLQQYKIPARLFNTQNLVEQVNKKLSQKYGEGKWVLKYMNQQVYLNEPLIQSKNLDVSQIEAQTVEIVLNLEGVSHAISRTDLITKSFIQEPFHKVQLGFHPIRSGNVVVLYQPNWFDDELELTATHGSQYSYDTHVPLLWYGWKIPRGKTYARVQITDIASTVAALLRIEQPNGCIGNPITDLMHAVQF
ncbi:MAG: alkaline phosphatase family protein [Bacteroidia bacterium]|nr:alkaline phosphatase family protein [Bacteroidia bacterium]MDW8301098.1 alkaline phosphatase family protein [Bacteroidia bacterium]